MSKPVDSLAATDKSGAFKRTESEFRDLISADHPVFKPARDRYHLYVAQACPWANRCIATLHLKGLTDVIGYTSVHPTWQRTKPDDPEDGHYGWMFYDSCDPDRIPFTPPCGVGSIDFPGLSPCDIPGVKTVRDIYEKCADVKAVKKFVVPILWDKESKTIVNNESSEIIRMLTKEFDEYATGPNKALDLYPEELRDEIDSFNEWIYPDINDGVYRCGFAKTQEAYEIAVNNLFTGLDKLEACLKNSRFLCGSNSPGGSKLTEADIRLFMTLARFDEVYVVYFKTNRKRLIDYPNIRNYMRDIYSFSENSIGNTINMDSIKTHYFTSHKTLNPYAIIPVGPEPSALDDMRMPAEGREGLN